LGITEDFMRQLLAAISIFALVSCAGSSNPRDPYPGSGGAFLGTPSDKDIKSGRALFTAEKCSAFKVGETTKAEVVEKLGGPAGWSTERDGTSILEYNYVEATGAFGMRRVTATFFSFDRSMMLFKIKCPGFDQAIAPKDITTFVYKCDAPIPAIPLGPSGRLKLNYWFSKDRNNVYLSDDPIEGADPESFRLACCAPSEVSGEDKNRCYWYDKAVPCDCKPHGGADFPSSFWELPPGKARITSRGFKDAVHVVTIDGKLEKASLNAELDAGEHVLGLKCPDLGDGATGTATMTVKAGRVYTLKPNDYKACEAHLEEYGIVRGKTFGPQISINNVPYEPGRDVPPSGVIEAKLLAGNYTLSVTCRDVRRDSIREATTLVQIKVEPMHFYQLDAQFSADTCDARVVTSEQL
jgi:hypothetical protein